MPSFRVDRQSEEIKHVLSRIIFEELKDPRIPPVLSVTYVDLSRDLSVAKVGVSAIGDDEQKKQILKALKGASKFLRHELGQRMILRAIPDLQFFFDSSIERGVHITNLLNQIIPNEQAEVEQDEDEIDT